MSFRGFQRLVKLAGFALTTTVLVVRPSTVVAAPRTHTVIIDKMKFSPVPKNVRAGDVILWVNRDIFRHTATARDRSFNIDLAPSARGKAIIKRGGAFEFYCIYHPGMTGRIVVAGK